MNTPQMKTLEHAYSLLEKSDDEFRVIVIADSDDVVHLFASDNIESFAECVRIMFDVITNAIDASGGKDAKGDS